MASKQQPREIQGETFNDPAESFGGFFNYLIIVAEQLDEKEAEWVKANQLDYKEYLRKVILAHESDYRHKYRGDKDDQDELYAKAWLLLMEQTHNPKSSYIMIMDIVDALYWRKVDPQRIVGSNALEEFFRKHATVINDVFGGYEWVRDDGTTRL